MEPARLTVRMGRRPVKSIVVDKTKALPDGFLGTLKQVCVVTRDYRKIIAGMLSTGIGPWTVFTFSPETCTDLTYRGRPVAYAAKICLARAAGVNWEVIQPISGPNIYADFLENNGEGVQHLLFDCNGVSWAEKTAAFEAAGYSCTQSGRWLGRLTFAYYGTEAATGTAFEIVDMPPDWRRPEPEEVYA
jgi:methylmalonyl-CoA/ethylmalonyl-CoA epimerase